jgi:hypothetical protein
MEARNITIVTTSNQGKYVINTDATTLGELKAALRANGIPYEGMTFYEGLSHSELLTDEAILPHDLPYRGSTTNELVFMLTTPNKKIRSGADNVRQALYDSIKELGLQEAVAARYGRNFTQCKNDELLAIIEEAQAAAPTSSSNIEEAFDALLDILEKTAVVSGAHIKKVRSILKKGEVEEAPYSDAEIDAMFKHLNQ